MITASGAQAKVTIKSTDVIEIQGRRVNIYNAVRKARGVPKTRIKGTGRGRAVLLVDQAVVTAVESWKAHDGYAGMKLQQYLEKVFGFEDSSSSNTVKGSIE